MTTNQTIDGVSREDFTYIALAARCMTATTGTKGWGNAVKCFSMLCTPYAVIRMTDEIERLRALLDAPVECRCKRYGKDNPHWPCPVHPVKPSAQHQGEPVAFEEWFRREIGGDPNDTNFKGLPTRDVYVARKAWNFRQPAPVAVVLPERNTIRTQNPIVMNGTELVQVWNACLDEVARLNKPTKKGD